MLRISYLLLFFFAAFGVNIGHAAQPSFPALNGRVVDDAYLLDPATASAIQSKLADLESKTGRQLVVVTLPSLQGYEIEDYGYQLGRAWGIGQKSRNNGALLIVAPNEHKVRIEVGYGLEGMLTDAVSRLIIENTILPRFRVNDFAGGIQRGVDDIIQVLSGDAADFQRRANQQTVSPIGSEDIGQLIFIAVLLALFFFVLFGSRRRGSGAMPWIIPMGGGWSTPGWGGGGGFGGGGFSGGGGSFGGGGASGRW